MDIAVEIRSGQSDDHRPVRKAAVKLEHRRSAPLGMQGDKEIAWRALVSGFDRDPVTELAKDVRPT